MNLVVVSQCAKNALTETRRVLDQFAERSGHRTWIFESTEQGQKQIRQMLKRTARKNTAVICYHIKKSGGKDILWLVGNPRRFNTSGAVPTNTTGRDILNSQLENHWHNLHRIKAFSAIAGLFHDVGKANLLFQKKLQNSSRTQEPVRHEWVSLRIFEAFVNGDTDSQWLDRLSKFTPKEETQILTRLVKDDLSQNEVHHSQNPFRNNLSAPAAKLIGWLIVSHHRLPDADEFAPIEDMNNWFTFGDLLLGNSPQAKPVDKIKNRNTDNTEQVKQPHWTASDWKNVFLFKQGTPLRSVTWCAKARKLASRTLKFTEERGQDWMNDPFVMHLCRLSLMLSDHVYSSQLPTEGWQDKSVNVWANTFRQDCSDENGIQFLKDEKKQKLDEHNIGVAQQSFHFPSLLPNLRRELSAFSYCKPLKAQVKAEHFRWQNKAMQLAMSLRQRSVTQGFIGFNLASTGRGKTLGNAKIMYALADEQQGCRFSVAVGLRTLTLQTGDAFKAKLSLSEEDIAVMIGSQAVLNLHQFKTMSDYQCDAERSGSESAEALLSDFESVHFEGSTQDSRLQRWLAGSDKAQKMLHAPVLVSTIDHLIPATEGCRGGRQIAPMLRLITSELVLDEPDEFGLEDLPALCRLVNWAGMLGTRVLLSSATIPPDLAYALFEAYKKGREYYCKNCLDPATDDTIICAWFDEKESVAYEVNELEQFKTKHTQFINKRIQHLQTNTAIQRGGIVDISGRADASVMSKAAAVEAISKAISQEIYSLHNCHNHQHPDTGQCFSLGVVRMANINPLVVVAKELLTKEAAQDYRFHFVVYHSQFPLIMRANLEKQLDTLFNRESSAAFWQHEVVKNIAERYTEKHQVLIVLSSPVCEVGRNWDADYAIYEPSSFRSFIQGAGRVNRHRRVPVTTPNIVFLNENYRQLIGEQVAFSKPGFENGKPFNLKVPKTLHTKIKPEQINPITAIPRISMPDRLATTESLIDLEHAHTRVSLIGFSKPFNNNPYPYFAKMWWENQITWCQRLQDKMPFRRSLPQQDYFFYLKEAQSDLQFQTRNVHGQIREAGEEQLQDHSDKPLELGERVSFLWQQDLKQALIALAAKQEVDIARCSEMYSEVKLEKDRQCHYHPDLGFYGEL